MSSICCFHIGMLLSKPGYLAYGQSLVTANHRSRSFLDFWQPASLVDFTQSFLSRGAHLSSASHLAFSARHFLEGFGATGAGGGGMPAQVMPLYGLVAGLFLQQDTRSSQKNGPSGVVSLHFPSLRHWPPLQTGNSLGGSLEAFSSALSLSAAFFLKPFSLAAALSAFSCIMSAAFFFLAYTASALAATAAFSPASLERFASRAAFSRAVFLA